LNFDITKCILLAMRHSFRHGGRDRHFTASGHRRDAGPGQGPEGRRRGRRPFDYGDLRLIVLGMIAEAPRHGYEIMKAIEARMGGGYSPSPGVIYPTLSWLEDMGYAASEATGGRRSYRLTPEGEAFLVANREAVEALDARMGAPRHQHDHHRHERPEPVVEAMGALRQALRARFAHGLVDPAEAEGIAAAIRAVAQQVEKTMTDTTQTASYTVQSVATAETPKAASYAAQLCKHFGHKTEAHFEDGRGEVVFPFGRLSLEVDGDRLTLTARAADAEMLPRVEEVTTSHLQRFAFREDLSLDWTRG
jgi:DNA-binding PadR family transcriptional regulator